MRVYGETVIPALTEHVTAKSMTNPDTAKLQPERETEGIALSLADPLQSRGRLSRFRRGDSPQRWFAIGWGVVGIVAVLLHLGAVQVPRAG